MTTISDLSFDLVEKIMSKVSIASVRVVRSTCKQWYALFKDESFTMKHCGKAAKEFLVIKTSDPTMFNLHNIKNLPSIRKMGQLLCPVDVYQVYHCDGLLLCVTKDYSLVVWSPYLAQTRWIETINVNFDLGTCWYAIGYDNNHNHKVLRFFLKFKEIVKLEIYDFKTNSWRVLDITINICVYHRGASLKGNTYFVDRKISEEGLVICFDFTTEKFGPLLNLPFHTDIYVEVILSCVREEQLVVLQYTHWVHELEIWITTKIEPNTVWWSKFFKVYLDPLAGSRFLSKFFVKNFFIIKEKKVAVVCGICLEKDGSNTSASFVVGEDGYYKGTGIKEDDVFSYVPSHVPIQ